MWSTFKPNHMKSITIPAGDVTQLPIIGRLTAKAIWGMDTEQPMFPEKDYDVVYISEDIYVVNQWYKPGVPQLIHKDSVLRYEPVKPNGIAANIRYTRMYKTLERLIWGEEAVVDVEDNIDLLKRFQDKGVPASLKTSVSQLKSMLPVIVIPNDGDRLYAVSEPEELEQLDSCFSPADWAAGVIIVKY